ncbi:MAG: hypothetical protein WCK41_08690 [Actinomycetes bacterium]
MTSPLRRITTWRARVVSMALCMTLSALVVGMSPTASGAAPSTPQVAPDDWTGGTSWVPGTQSSVTGSLAARSLNVPEAAVYTFGKGPLDDTLYWANQRSGSACGLTTNQLASIMLAPTYPETGASGLAAPSPMTLSRYDTSAGLYAFGSKSTVYPKAFWHPGVGAWAFDSAGGWKLSGAQAMSTDSAAQQAATTIASRWCTSTGTDAERRASVWGMWFGCNSGVCETIYNAIYDPTTLHVNVDPTVSRGGGTTVRNCTVPGLGTVTCTYVDPALAEGSVGWRIPIWGPSPVSAPYYNFISGSTEYRVWLREDSGYGVTISASKPVTANARTALSWTQGDSLCDLSTYRGACVAYTGVYLRNSQTGGVADVSYHFVVPSGGRTLMCDIDGNGSQTPTKVVNGIWYVTDSTSGGPATRIFAFGNGSDIPVCGDWNGDRIDTPGIVRAGRWYLTNTLGSPTAELAFGYGDSADVPVVGDWNGDGTDTPGIVRRGTWYLANSIGKISADLVFGYGSPTDVAVIGDWNNDGIDTPGVKRGNIWYLVNSVTKGTADYSFAFGDVADKPITGRWVIGAGSTVGIVREFAG